MTPQICGRSGPMWRATLTGAASGSASPRISHERRARYDDASMSLAIPSRRGFLFGAGATLLAAPAIVRVASLMPVSVSKLIMPDTHPYPFLLTNGIIRKEALIHLENNLVLSRLT